MEIEVDVEVDVEIELKVEVEVEIKVKVDVEVDVEVEVEVEWEVQGEVEVEDSQVHKRENFQVHKREDSQVHKRCPCQLGSCWVLLATLGRWRAILSPCGNMLHQYRAILGHVGLILARVMLGNVDVAATRRGRVKDREVGVIGARWAGTHELGKPFEVSTLTAAAVKKKLQGWSWSWGEGVALILYTGRRSWTSISSQGSKVGTCGGPRCSSIKLFPLSEWVRWQ